MTPSRQQPWHNRENERGCRTIIQQLVSSIHQNVLTSTSYKRKEQVKGTQRKTVTFEDQDQKSEEVEQNLGQESLSGEKVVNEKRRNYSQDPGQGNMSGESDVDENVQGEEQDLEDKILSGELRWIIRAHKSDPEEETCSVTESSVDDNSRNSGVDIYSDRDSSTGLELSVARWRFDTC